MRKVNNDDLCYRLGELFGICITPTLLHGELPWSCLLSVCLGHACVDLCYAARWFTVTSKHLQTKVICFNLVLPFPGCLCREERDQRRQDIEHLASSLVNKVNECVTALDDGKQRVLAECPCPAASQPSACRACNPIKAIVSVLLEPVRVLPCSADYCHFTSPRETEPAVESILQIRCVYANLTLPAPVPAAVAERVSRVEMETKTVRQVGQDLLRLQEKLEGEKSMR